MHYTDLILLDIKHIDSRAHQRLTGWSNENILNCARYLSEINLPVWIRHVLVPGLTDDDECLFHLRDFLKTLRNIRRIEVLPYHSMGLYKWDKLGIPYTLRGVDSPTSERVKNAERILGEALSPSE